MTDTILVDGTPLTVTNRRRVDGIELVTVRGLTNEPKTRRTPTLKSNRKYDRNDLIAARDAIDIAMGNIGSRSYGGHRHHL